MKLTFKKKHLVFVGVLFILILITLIIIRPKIAVSSKFDQYDGDKLFVNSYSQGLNLPYKQGFYKKYKYVLNKSDVAISNNIINKADFNEGNNELYVTVSRNYLFFELKQNEIIKINVIKDTAIPEISFEQLFDSPYLSGQMIAVKSEPNATLYSNGIKIKQLESQDETIELKSIDGENVDVIYVEDEAGNRSESQEIKYNAVIKDGWKSVICKGLYIPYKEEFITSLKLNYGISNNTGGEHKTNDVSKVEDNCNDPTFYYTDLRLVFDSQYAKISPTSIFYYWNTQYAPHINVRVKDKSWQEARNYEFRDVEEMDYTNKNGVAGKLYKADLYDLKYNLKIGRYLEFTFQTAEGWQSIKWDERNDTLTDKFSVEEAENLFLETIDLVKPVN